MLLINELKLPEHRVIDHAQEKFIMSGHAPVRPIERLRKNLSNTLND